MSFSNWTRYSERSESTSSPARAACCSERSIFAELPWRRAVFIREGAWSGKTRLRLIRLASGANVLASRARTYNKTLAPTKTTPIHTQRFSPRTAGGYHRPIANVNASETASGNSKIATRRALAARGCCSQRRMSLSWRSAPCVGPSTGTLVLSAICHFFGIVHPT